MKTALVQGNSLIRVPVYLPQHIHALQNFVATIPAQMMHILPKSHKRQ